MMTTRSKSFLPLLALGSLALAGCDPGSTGPEFATGELSAELAITPDHFHIYETEGMFTVAVTDPDGQAVTDFVLVRLEGRRVGTSLWGDALDLNLELEGDLYVGTHVFEESGNYELRVTGLRESDPGLFVLYQAEAPLAVVRPHADVGGRRLELEASPGHVHAGDQSEVIFWIMDPQPNGQGVRPPITGLEPTIWVEVNGVRTSYATAEWDQPGFYSTGHRFTVVGPTRVGITFLGADGQQHEWSMEIEVHPPH
jgi:hypothetical protein